MLKKGLLISLVIVFVLVIIKDEKRYNIKQEIFNYNLYQECPYKLKIKKINLNECLYNIDDENNSLEVGLEILYEKPLVIAGHSGTGRLALFNSLNELVLGDEVKIASKLYKIVEIEEKNKKDKLHVKDDLVLVTCLINTEKQLVLYAKLV